MCNPDAIMTHLISALSLCFSPVRGAIYVSMDGAISKLHSLTDNGQEMGKRS
jgi:hypothetical protein